MRNCAFVQSLPNSKFYSIMHGKYLKHTSKRLYLLVYPKKTSIFVGYRRGGSVVDKLSGIIPNFRELIFRFLNRWDVT